MFHRYLRIPSRSFISNLQLQIKYINLSRSSLLSIFFSQPLSFLQNVESLIDFGIFFVDVFLYSFLPFVHFILASHIITGLYRNIYGIHTKIENQYRYLDPTKLMLDIWFTNKLREKHKVWWNAQNSEFIEDLEKV